MPRLIDEGHLYLAGATARPVLTHETKTVYAR